MVTGDDILAVSPALSMAGIALLAIIADTVFKNKRAIAYSAVALMIFVLLLSLNNWFGYSSEPFGGAIEANEFTSIFQIILTVTTAVVVLASISYVHRLRGYEGELLALTLLASSGMLLLVSARELITTYVAFELTALPVVGVAALRRDRASIESSVKFLVLSAIASAFLLFGIVFIYGYTGSTYFEEILMRLERLIMENGNEPFGSYAVLAGVVMMMMGFAFKMAILPWQMWVPDVYQGAPTPLAAFLSTASKASGFAILLSVIYIAFGHPSVLEDWSLLLAALSAASMTYGNLGALVQSNVKRLLGYSTIAHAGYILVGVAAITSGGFGYRWAEEGPQSVIFYLIGYPFSNLAVFLVVIAVTNKMGSSNISAFKGLGTRSPLLAIFMTIGLLSLLGLPPTVGFVSKLLVFSSAINANSFPPNLTWLVIIGAINSVLSAYYYLKIVRTMFFEEPETKEKLTSDKGILILSALSAIGVILFGVFPFIILYFTQRAAFSIL